MLQNHEKIWYFFDQVTSCIYFVKKKTCLLLSRFTWYWHTVFIPISAHALISAHPSFWEVIEHSTSFPTVVSDWKSDRYQARYSHFSTKPQSFFTKMAITQPDIDRFSIRNQRWKAGKELHHFLLLYKRTLRLLERIRYFWWQSRNSKWPKLQNFVYFDFHLCY